MTKGLFRRWFFTDGKFNFTIREVLISMVAIGAIVALAAQNIPSAPTGIPEEVLAEALVKDACASLGMPAPASINGGHSGGGGGTDFEYTSHASFAVSNEAAAYQVMNEIRKDVSDEIEKRNCRRNGMGWSGRSKTELDKFSFEYTRWKTRGRIRVQMTRNESLDQYFSNSMGGSPAESWTLTIDTYEYCR